MSLLNRPENEEFKNLFDKSSDMIYSLGVRFFRDNNEEILDFSQEVYLRALQKWNTFKSKSSRTTWLYSIALNLGLNKIKKAKWIKKKQGTKVDLEDFENIIKIEDANYSENKSTELDFLFNETHVELQKKIQDELSNLSEEYRIPLILHYYEKLPYQEISEKLGIKIGTLKSNVYRGKLILRKKLGNLLNEI